MLYVVATPIGNIKDISKRALEVLEDVDFIIAEDTRKTGILCKRYNISKKPFVSFHKYNEKKSLGNIVEKLKQGKRGALVSNAGTPGISDPGYLLVKKCREEQIDVVSLPGPTAVINALVLSGFPLDTFLFLGYLPKKQGERKKKLESVKQLDTTLVIFESPYRVLRLLNDIRKILGDKQCALIREMTKMFEEARCDSLSHVISSLEDKKIKGEVTVVIDNRA
jgi:16S rRNA (cytidine1402-2'-O)-methyltransferase